MTDDPVEFRMSQCAGALLAAEIRINELEHILRHFDRTSMDLHHYARGIESRPSQVEWLLVKDQIAEMVDAYGPRNPDR
jgi:dGTP triphosphohydrolase